MFEAVEINGKFKVIDRANGRFLAYSYGKPIYEDEGKKVKFSVWGNRFSAEGFAAKMNKANEVNNYWKNVAHKHNGFPGSLSD